MKDRYGVRLEEGLEVAYTNYSDSATYKGTVERFTEKRVVIRSYSRRHIEYKEPENIVVINEHS